MENNELISIVVPIYNVEKYLKQCIDSIIAQTYKKIQIILIEDGSTDNCSNICDEYLEKDERIEVIHKLHGGVSDARNYGLSKAKGKYIAFIDSDDYVCDNYIEKLYDAIIRNNAKIAQCNFIKVNDNNEEINKVGYINQNKIKTGKEITKDTYTGHWENILIWNKLYSIELFEDLKYPVGKIHEDEYITYKILYRTERVAIVEDYLYKYRKNNNSITRQTFNEKRLDALQAYEERLDFFDEQKEMELYEMSLMVYLRVIRDCYVKTRKHISESKDIQKNLIKKHNKNCKGLLIKRHISILEKIKALVFFFTPILYYKVIKNKK